MRLFTVIIAVAAGLAGLTGTATEFSNAPSNQVTPSSTHLLRVVVDPRVELMSLIFHLAGNPEYNLTRVGSYATDAENQFGKFRGHAVVNLARELRQTRGVSYDAVITMAIHLTDAEHLGLRLPLQPWPEGLDQRWTAADVTNFLAAAQQFVIDSSFQEFIDQHGPLYRTTVLRMQTLLDQEAHLEWFDAYFGRRPGASFTVALGLLIGGGGNYGPHFRNADGHDELYCILGVSKTDKQGLPEFTRDPCVFLLVHEFCHSYANPLIERHLAELSASGDALFDRVADRMHAQAYGDGQTLLKESLVRACVVRYVRRHEGAQAARRLIQAEQGNGFLWMQELSDLLGDYEAHRDRYPTLEEFSPRLAAFFAEVAKQPKGASTNPAIVNPGWSTGRAALDQPIGHVSFWILRLGLILGPPFCIGMILGAVRLLSSRQLTRFGVKASIAAFGWSVFWTLNRLHSQSSIAMLSVSLFFVFLVALAATCFGYWLFCRSAQALQSRRNRRV